MKHFATQDGPAHIYTASVTKDLIFHRQTSPYHAIYRIQKKPLPNWTCTVLLMGWLSLFGPDYAEAFLTTLCLLLGYFSFRYCILSIHANAPPLFFANWIIQSWFLWAGFYNFTLGMMLLPLVIGLYLRRKHVVTITGVLLLIFFTHLIPAALAIMAIGIIAVWEKRPIPFAVLPTLVLLAIYAFQFRGADISRPDILAALREFPGHLFTYSGELRYVWIAVAVAILLSFRRSPLTACAIAAFGLFLLMPDTGFGGSVVKLRFAWAAFLFGGLLIRTPWISLLGIITAIQLIGIASHVRRTSDTVAEQLTAEQCLPVGARFVRLYYSGPRGLSFDPLLHTDELIAVRRHAVALSDYQSATGTFSIDFKKEVDNGQRFSLSGFETPGEDSWAAIKWLSEGLPVTITHVLWVGESGAKDNAPARLLCSNTGTPFVRIYELR